MVNILPRFKFEVLTRSVIGLTVLFGSKDHDRYRGLQKARNTILLVNVLDEKGNSNPLIILLI